MFYADFDESDSSIQKKKMDQKKNGSQNILFLIFFRWDFRSSLLKSILLTKWGLLISFCVSNVRFEWSM